jgi:hypothetical protein
MTSSQSDTPQEYRECIVQDDMRGENEDLVRVMKVRQRIHLYLNSNPYQW